MSFDSYRLAMLFAKTNWNCIHLETKLIQFFQIDSILNTKYPKVMNSHFSIKSSN